MAAAPRRRYADSVPSFWAGAPLEAIDRSPKENAFDGWAMSDAMATQEKCEDLLRDPFLSQTDAHEFLQNVWLNVFGYAGLTLRPEKSEVRSNLENLSRVCEEALDFMMTKQIRLDDVLSHAEMAIWQSAPPSCHPARPLTPEQRLVTHKVAVYKQTTWRGELKVSRHDPSMHDKLSAVVNEMKTDFKMQFRARQIKVQRCRWATFKGVAEREQLGKGGGKGSKGDASDRESSGSERNEKGENRKKEPKKRASSSDGPSSTAGKKEKTECVVGEVKRDELSPQDRASAQWSLSAAQHAAAEAETFATGNYTLEDLET